MEAVAFSAARPGETGWQPFHLRAWHEWRNRDQIQTEASTIRRFVEEADSGGLLIPGDLDKILEELDLPFRESSYINAFEAGEVEWPPRVLRPTIALAQHYGIGTRFLDWSWSPFAAAYFAAVGSFDQPSNVSSFAVWAYSTMADSTRFGLTLGSRGVKRTVLTTTAPYSTNPNLRMQEGVHLLRLATKVMWTEPAERYDFAAHLNKVGEFGAQMSRVSLLKFVVCRKEAPELLWYLAKEGISASRLFPGYSGAARAVIESKLHVQPV